MKVYKVRMPFVNATLGQKYVGEPFPEHLIRFLTEEEKEKLDEKILDTSYDLFNYGLIFYSTEFPFPETIPDETYSEMLCRMIEMNKTCCNPECECKNNE